jgi:hypothetical protein
MEKRDLRTEERRFQVKALPHRSNDTCTCRKDDDDRMMQESESALNTDIAHNTARKKNIVIQPFTKRMILCTFLP